MKETEMKEKLNRARMILLQLMRKLNQSMVKEKMKLLQGAGPNSDLAEWIEIPVIDEEAAEDESAEKGGKKAEGSNSESSGEETESDEDETELEEEEEEAE
ncbi:hypothetical protein U1Q18_014251, partial [Sarracenia purpurea var. burkii]